MLFAAVLSLCVLTPNISTSQLIPSDRVIPWQGNVGVEGGIPHRTNTRNCTDTDGARADGTDASSSIQACIDNSPAGGVAYLPAGIYTLDTGIRLSSNKTLRGAGIDITILSAGDMSEVVSFGDQYGHPSAIDIVSGYTKGSGQLVLADAESIDVGAFLRVDELNDAAIPVTEEGYGTCTWCGRENGARVRGQIVKVVARDGNTISISPEMYFTFSSSNLPQVQPLGGPTPSGMVAEYAGIEDLTIQNSGPSYRDQRIPLNVYLTANCWARNIKIENCGARCIQFFYDNYRFELRDSTVTKCVSDRSDSNDCYGTLIGMYNSGLLIENNIYESVADGPMFAWGASGNVVGYNYIYDAHRTNVQRTWFTAIGASHHGAHTAYNLWEGNEVESAYFDQYWGSHSHNTLFRNRILGKYMVDGISDDSQIQNVSAIGTERNVHYQNYLGNVLGTAGYHDTYEMKDQGCPDGLLDKLIYRTGYPSSGDCTYYSGAFDTMLRHMNYDYVTSSVKHCSDAGEPGCQGSDGSTVLPDSLYLASKPDWFGTDPWAVIGPDVNPMGGTIPAKRRFEGHTDLPVAPGDVNGDGAIDVIDVQACANHALGHQDLGEAADVNGSGDVDELDVQEILAILLEQ